MKKVIPFSSKPDTDRVAAAVSGRASLPAGQGLTNIPGSWSGGPEQQLLLMQRLIGCNDVESLISLFFRWCNDLGLADGLTYETSNGRADIKLGNRRHHSANYSLTLDQMELGRITLCRRERYSENELLSIEQALGTVARCLRTAIEFQMLHEMVTQDGLTGLGNRVSLHQWIERELSRTRRHKSPLSLMMIDVDHFKKINDELGHLGGDHVLKTIASVFKRSTRGTDLLFRFGGDEFTILLPHTDLQGARDAARQIRANLARIGKDEFGLGEATEGIRPDISIGIADYQIGDTQESLLQRADTRLYHAKAQGRGAVCSNV
ncbi:MAG: diguanylate cyclase (GGDEF)-like protein [Glaciecola sp.]|jgi:diguanylate cyclase (GGDEF)-like protein|uniref:GGDEF domain-containing protein n=1 Tax=Congregibacter sp. TaxID=2744308 RepID=UPI0039E2725B